MFDPAPILAAFMLSTEARTWLFQGLKESFIRENLDVSLLRYYQMLNALLDTELALIIDPLTTNRLRAIRSTRRLVG